MSQNNEASVEEILESIKKVIARDARAPAPQSRKESSPAPEEAPLPPVDPEEVLDLADLEFAEVADAGEDPEEAPLITEKVRGAMEENLAALAMLAQPGARPQIVRSGETSLEGLTRELLRPMLAEWLDANLPGMVEKMVQAEIARIAGKRR